MSNYSRRTWCIPLFVVGRMVDLFDWTVWNSQGSPGSPRRFQTISMMVWFISLTFSCSSPLVNECCFNSARSLRGFASGFSNRASAAWNDTWLDLLFRHAVVQTGHEVHVQIMFNHAVGRMKVLLKPIRDFAVLSCFHCFLDSSNMGYQLRTSPEMLRSFQKPSASSGILSATATATAAHLGLG